MLENKREKGEERVLQASHASSDPVAILSLSSVSHYHIFIKKIPYMILKTRDPSIGLTQPEYKHSATGNLLLGDKRLVFINPFMEVFVF